MAHQGRATGAALGRRAAVTSNERDWESLLSGREPREGGGRRPKQRPAPRPLFRRAPQRRRDPRDQFGLKIGWVRLWLRGVGLGIGIAFLGASLVLWQPLAPAAGPFFAAGLVIAPAAGLLALLTWAVPYPLLQTTARCPQCGYEDRVLRLPWPTVHTCRHCRRRGLLRAGRLEIDASPRDPRA